MTRRSRLSLAPEQELRKAPPKGRAPECGERVETASARQSRPNRAAPEQPPPSRKAATRAQTPGVLPAWLNARTMGKALLVVGVAAASIFLLKRRL